jgi:hypothetical protein
MNETKTATAALALAFLMAVASIGSLPRLAQNSNDTTTNISATR